MSGDLYSELKFQTSLGSDNHAGVHPLVWQALSAANRGHAHAYGLDEVCEMAKAEFARVFGSTVQPEYVFTGTAANVLSLAPFLKSYQAVIASEMAHLHQDECGAPEKFWGSKLLTVPTKDGRISPRDIEIFLERGGDQHYAQPRAVSLTLPTETGVCYSLRELKEWRQFTRGMNLLLHLDGARIANAAVHLGVDLKTLTADLDVDVVSFGGTKNGLLGAEAVLLFSDEAKRDFKFYRKQAMQLSSKTRFIAAQFHAYLKNDLWREIAKHTTEEASRLANLLTEFPEIKIAYPVQSNAVFVQLPKTWIKPLKDRFFFYIWDSRSNLCRWMISWDWSKENTNQILNALHEVKSCLPK